jgi:hypothetical protein
MKVQAQGEGLWQSRQMTLLFTLSSDTRTYLRAFLGSAAVTVSATLVLLACSSDAPTVEPNGQDAATTSSSSSSSGGIKKPDASSGTPDADVPDTGTMSDAGDSGTPELNPWCAALAKKHDVCDGERQCGAKFDTWCPVQSATNSLAYEKADGECLAPVDTDKNACKVDVRRACRYAKYDPALLTNEQTALISAYCQACPSANCEASLRRYRKGLTPEDAFVAVWELSDPITKKMREECTKLLAPATCAKEFSDCATPIYLDSLSDCP